jgi:ATP-dependent exoDNAse (exonuclease V) beta subunit
MYDLTRNKNLIPFTDTVHTIWGKEVHTALEHRVLGPPHETEDDKFKAYYPFADKVASLPGEKFVERQFALTKNLTPTTFGAQDAWVRGIIDIGVVHGNKALVADWKTGKIRPDSDQLKLFAAFIFEHYKEVERVSTVYVWLAHNKVTKEKYTRADLPGIWQHFMGKANRLEQAYAKDKWIPKPSGLCGWCGAGQKNCEFWFKRKT